MELEQIAEGAQETPKEDGLAALRQLPAPIYALDTLNAVLSIMARSVVDVETLSLVRFHHSMQVCMLPNVTTTVTPDLRDIHSIS